jgi:Zn-dependent protease
VATQPYDGQGLPLQPVLPPPIPPPPPYEPWREHAPPAFNDEVMVARPRAAPRTLRDHWQRISSGLLAGLAALWKLKILTIVLKLKFLTFFGTMFISFAAYAVFYGWQFAVGLIVLLAVHEFGHLVVLRARGVNTSLPVFVPLFGAFVTRAPTTVYTSALGSLAGPGFGALGALGSLWIWDLGAPPVYRAIAAFGFFMNLFNLAPIPILDGGHIFTALRGKLSNGKGSARVYGLEPTQRALVGVVYVGLIVVLVWATKGTYFHRSFS